MVQTLKSVALNVSSKVLKNGNRNSAVKNISFLNVRIRNTKKFLNDSNFQQQKSNKLQTMNSSGKKTKTAEILISKVFLKYHSKAGEPTDFEQKIKSGEKKHTIRSNFKEWKKRLSNENGKTILVVKQWTGIPNRSLKVKLFEISPEDGFELAKLTHVDGRFYVNDETEVTIEQLAKNDGLSVEDFTDWFKVFSTEPMALIYFSKFRY